MRPKRVVLPRVVMCERCKRVQANDVIERAADELVHLFEGAREILVLADDEGELEPEEGRRAAGGIRHQPAEQRHRDHRSVEHRMGAVGDRGLPCRGHGNDRRRRIAAPDEDADDDQERGS